jgi:hypothetical protein
MWPVFILDLYFYKTELKFASSKAGLTPADQRPKAKPM